jgi:energy-coupling factor transporter ATP-binding protein EcfA2
MAAAISIENLSHKYPNGREALRSVNLQVEDGTVVGLIGRNGAGKTTLAKHLNSLLKPTSGRLSVLGVNVSDKTTSEMADIVGYVFQNPEDQIFESTVLDEVAFGPKNLGIDPKQIVKDVHSSLELVGLLQLQSEHPYNLTYGQRKMLCIASVLATHPSIVILDEPNVGQDYHGLQSLSHVLSDLQKNGKTIVIISHDIEFVAQHTQETVLMDNGQIIAKGKTRHVLSDFDSLETSAVRPPQVTRLAAALSRFGIRRDIITVSEMADTLASR